MAAEPLRGQQVTVNGVKLHLIATNKALRIAQKRFDGKAVRDVIRVIDIDQICELGAAFAIAQTPFTDDEWFSNALEEDPEAQFPLAKAILAAFSESAMRALPKEAVEAMKKKLAPTPTTETKASESPMTDGPTSEG